MKRTLKILFPILLLSLIVYFIFNKPNESNEQAIENFSEPILKEEVPEESTPKQILPKEDKKGSNTFLQTDIIEDVQKITASWQAYSNKNIGYSFKYPSYWRKDKDEIKAVDLKGVIKSIEIYFKDTVNNNSFLVKYHPNPNASVLYEYKLAQYKASEGLYQTEKKEILIDTYKAIVGSSIRTTNGKGFKIDPPSRLIIVDMLCDKIAGKLEIQYRTDENQKESVDVFYQVLKTFKILNKN